MNTRRRIDHLFEHRWDNFFASGGRSSLSRGKPRALTVAELEKMTGTERKEKEVPQRYRAKDGRDLRPRAYEDHWKRSNISQDAARHALDTRGDETQPEFAREHMLKIARDTLRMPDAMAGVMGGMSKERAREVLRKFGKFGRLAGQKVHSTEFR